MDRKNRELRQMEMADGRIRNGTSPVWDAPVALS